MRSARGRARGAQCRAPRQVPGRCDDGQIPRPRGNPHLKAFVPEGRVPDIPTPTIMLNVKWHDLDRPCCRDGANGSRSALRELFNYAHVIPIFERGDAPGSWRSRRGGWCPTATSRGVRNTASSGLLLGVTRTGSPTRRRGSPTPAVTRQCVIEPSPSAAVGRSRPATRSPRSCGLPRLCP